MSIRTQSREGFANFETIFFVRNRSFACLMMVDPGMRTNVVLAAFIPLLSGKHCPDAASNIAFFRQVIERLEATQSVEAAGTSNSLAAGSKSVGRRRIEIKTPNACDYGAY